MMPIDLPRPMTGRVIRVALALGATCLLTGFAVAPTCVPPVAAGDVEFEIASTRRVFHAQAGATVYISVATSTKENPCSATISLFAPDGRLIARQDDYLRKVLPYTGRYTVRVQGCTSGLEISLVPAPRPDEFEPDDTPIMARLMPTGGEPQIHTLHTPHDFDWVTFHADEGQLLTIETYLLRNDCDTVLTLYDSGLVQMALRDDYNGDERSFLRLLAPRTGQYFARVHHRAALGEAGKAYHLRVRVEEPVYAGKIRIPQRIAFPKVRVGRSQDRVVQVTNLGTRELLRFAVQSVEGPFATDLPEEEVVLLPRGSSRFTVRFTPPGKGPAAGKLVLTTTDPDHTTMEILLSGRAL